MAFTDGDNGENFMTVMGFPQYATEPRENIENSLAYQAAKEAVYRHRANNELDIPSFEEGAEYGYELAIKRACEWLECLETDLGYYATRDFIKQFKQTMEK